MISQLALRMRNGRGRDRESMGRCLSVGVDFLVIGTPWAKDWIKQTQDK